MDEVKKDIQTIRESQIRMEADIKYHIKRTDLLELRVEKNTNHIEQIRQPMPLKEKIQIGSFVAAAVSTVTAILKYFGL